MNGWRERPRPTALPEEAACASGAAPRRRALAWEYALAALILGAIGLAAWRLGAGGYLPQPFHYDVGASLMDLYYPAYWANRSGAYDIWQAIYPPLAFVFLRLTSLHACYAGGAIAGRDCDGRVLAVLVGFFALNIPLVHLVYRRIDPLTAWPRTIAMCLGLPMLYGLDRGNLLIPAFTFFVLAEGGLLRSPPLRWVALAIALNFKPYLLVALIPDIVRRRWRSLAGCGVAGLAVYLLTFLLQGAGTPLELVGNVVRYAAGLSGTHWSNIYFATSYWPLAHMMAAGASFTSSIPAWERLALGIAMALAIRGAQLGAVLCLLAALVRPDRVDPRRFTALAAAIVLTTITTGSSGYIQVFLFFLVLMEPWRGPVRIAILTAAYLLCMPFDIAFWPEVFAPARAFLSGRRVDPDFGVSVGQLARPAVLLIVQYGLIVLNLQDLVRPGDRWLGARFGGRPRTEPAGRPAPTRGPS